MSVVIHNVTSAATNVQFKYLESTRLFGLDVEGTYTFSIDELEYEEGQIILNGTNAFNALREAYTNKHIVAKIGTDTFHVGQIVSLSRSSQNIVNSNEATITIRETKRVTNSSELSYLDNIVPRQHEAESYSESSSFSRSGNEVSYTRTVSLKYSNDIDARFFKKAYLFLRNTYFLNRPSYGFQIDGLSEKFRLDGGFRPAITETYDLINKEISLTENLTVSNVVGSYSKKVTYNIRLNPEGFKEKEYNIEIIGLKQPLSHHALIGTKDVINSLVTENSAEFGTPVSITKTVAKDANVITSQVLFSSNPALNQASSIVYSVARSLNGSHYEYTVNTERNRTDKNRQQSFEDLKSDWSAAQSVPLSKVNYLFPETVSLGIYEKSRSTNFSPSSAAMSESIVFTTNEAYNQSGDVLKSSESITTTKPVERVFQFAVPGDKERIQRCFKNRVGTLGSKSITVERIYKKSAGEAASETDAFNIAIALPPEGTSWIAEKTSSIDPLNGVTSATVTFDYYVS